MNQLLEYDKYVDKGKGGIEPAGYKKIRCHLIYVVKYDGSHKSRLVAGEHLISPNTEILYSGAVSLRCLRSVVFFAKMTSFEQ
jgi:hypothetical protein